MYDEFERSVTGKSKQGIPVFGWILIVSAFVVMLGVVGVGFAAYRTVTMVKREFSAEMAGELARELEEVERELAVELRGLDAETASQVSAALREARQELESSFGDEASAYAANLLSRMGPGLDHLLKNPTVGLALLQDLGSSDSPEHALRDVLEGSLRIRTGEGELAAELWSGEDGGSLVIQGADGDELTLDLVKADEGGALKIQSREGTVRLGAGSEAAELPGWVGEFADLPGNAASIFSVESDEGGMGAVSWETGASAGAVLENYRDAVSWAGYRIREEHSAQHHGMEEMGFWAENHQEDRVIFLSISEKDGVTRVLLGYGEEAG